MIKPVGVVPSYDTIIIMRHKTESTNVSFFCQNMLRS